MRAFYARMTILLLLIVLMPAPTSHAAEEFPGKESAAQTISLDCGDGASDGFVYDDGIPESAIPISSLLDYTFVQQFTPPSYPYHFTGMCVGLGSLHDTFASIQVVIYDDDGAGGTPQTLLWSDTASNTPVPNMSTTLEFDFSARTLDFTLNAGSVYIGITNIGGGEGIYLMGDTHHTATNYSKTSGAWSGGANYALMLRAEGQALPLAAPSLITPDNRAHTTDLTPTFIWSSINYAQAYRLMIYNVDHSFEFKQVVNGTSFSLTTPLTPQRYYWRVRTRNTSELWGSWSRRNVLFVE